MTSYLITVSDKDEHKVDALISSGVHLYAGGPVTAGAVVEHIVKAKPNVHYTVTRPPGESDPRGWHERGDYASEENIEIDTWPWRDQGYGEPGYRIHAAAGRAHDQDCSRAPTERVTWLTAGAERIAAVVPVEAAEDWLESETDPESAGVTRTQTGAGSLTEAQQRILDDVVRGYRRNPHLLPREVVITYRGGVAEHRTKTGRLLSEAEIRALKAEERERYPLRTVTGRNITEPEIAALSAEAEQGYEVMKPATVRKIARVIAMLMFKGMITETDLGAPVPIAMDPERATADIEGWLRS